MTQEERNTIAENIYTQELKEFIQYIILSILLFVVYSVLAIMSAFIAIHNPDIFKPCFFCDTCNLWSGLCSYKANQ